MPLKCVNSHKTEFVLASGQTDNFQNTQNFSLRIYTTAIDKKDKTVLNRHKVNMLCKKCSQL